MHTSPQDCKDADYRMRHERPESQADRFEAVATDTAVKTFEALRALAIGQGKTQELALIYDAMFEVYGWPDMEASNVFAKARRIMGLYAESKRWFDAARLERVA